LNYASLYQALGYQFAQDDILTRALTHASAKGTHNERLEFLGDALLGYLIAEILYQRFPQANEGELTRLRSNLVRRDTLAHIARNLDIGKYLILGSGEIKAEGFRRDSILANSVEALIAAVYLDGRLESCRVVVENIFQSLITDLHPTKQMKDPKSRLQEYLQAQHLSLPVYTILSITGTDHEQTFCVRCSVEIISESILGHGSTRRRAEQDAADHALKIILNSLENKKK